MRFLSVFLPSLPTDRILRRRAPSAREAPFALSHRIKGGERLAAVNAAAAAAKLRPGMAVADARALCPFLTLEERAPEADSATLAAIADWCGRFTPLVALDAPDGVMLDVTGAAQLFGGEAALLDEIVRRLDAQGFRARTALAPGPALARALARFGKERLIPPALPPREIAAIAARLPLEALAPPEPAKTRLARAGLRCVGDLLARPRAPLAARLGQETLAKLDALLCRSRDPIAPRFPAPAFVAERRFPDGLTQIADIETTLERLAEDLRAPLERHGVGARQLEAGFYRVDGDVKRLSVGTSRPLRDPKRIFGLLRERLGRLAEEGLDTGYGFDVLRLCAVVVEPLGEEQREFARENLELHPSPREWNSGKTTDTPCNPPRCEISRSADAAPIPPLYGEGGARSATGGVSALRELTARQRMNRVEITAPTPKNYCPHEPPPDPASPGHPPRKGEGFEPRDSTLFGQRSATHASRPEGRLQGEDGNDADIADLVDRLGARLGTRRVLRVQPQERHAPEAAVRAAPAAYAAPAEETKKFAPLARPLRLFERPEPIDAMALAPDGPPMRFRWRRALHETAAFEGPERIAPPWWQAPQNSLTRDYYNVVDKEGRRFWLYREGAPGHDTVFARWFVHGLY